MSWGVRTGMRPGAAAVPSAAQRATQPSGAGSRSWRRQVIGGGAGAAPATAAVEAAAGEEQEVVSGSSKELPRRHRSPQETTTLKVHSCWLPASSLTT